MRLTQVLARLHFVKKKKINLLGDECQNSTKTCVLCKFIDNTYKIKVDKDTAEFSCVVPSALTHYGNLNTTHVAPCSDQNCLDCRNDYRACDGCANDFLLVEFSKQNIICQFKGTPRFGYFNSTHMKPCPQNCKSSIPLFQVLTAKLNRTNV